MVIKEIDFDGDIIACIKNEETGKVYVGISWICNGIGLSKSQKDTQVQKIQTDLALKLGCLKFQAGVLDANNEVVSIELDYLPLWLAKINITPKMQATNPNSAKKLLNYQLKAKDVLATAFIDPKEVSLNNFKIPSTLSEALLLSANLAKQNETMKPKAEQFDLYLTGEGTLSLNQSAKTLKTKRNKLMSFLRYKNVFNADNTPRSYYANKGYFEVKTFTYVRKNGKLYQVAITQVTPRGQNFLYRYLKKHIDEYSKFDCNFSEKIREVAE